MLTAFLSDGRLFIVLLRTVTRRPSFSGRTLADKDILR
uniref:Uncharacterized protein n=1 Tax=Bacillus amyloliquefaciens TaxID=1390 RepID=A0A5P6A798_BACAM|nr:hypothetical protein TSBSO38_1734 [Bacillus amyloliquefaciens]